MRGEKKEFYCFFLLGVVFSVFFTFVFCAIRGSLLEVVSLSRPLKIFSWLIFIFCWPIFFQILVVIRQRVKESEDRFKSGSLILMAASVVCFIFSFSLFQESSPLDRLLIRQIQAETFFFLGILWFFVSVFSFSFSLKRKTTSMT